MDEPSSIWDKDDLEEAPLRLQVAGLLSTIDFIPSQRHPEDMLFLADRVIAIVQKEIVQ